MRKKEGGWMSGVDEVKRNKLQEVILFLMITFVLLAVPALFFCIDTCSFPILALITIFRNIGLSFLVFLFLRLRGEPFSLIGWTKDNFGRNIFLGIFLFPLFYFSIGLVLDLFTHLGLSHIQEVPEALMPKGVGQILLGILLVFVVAIAEEIIFRGYLLGIIAEITDSVGVGVLLSTILFSLGHGYEGAAGMLTVGYIGLIFSLLFLWQKNLTLIIVLHFLTDFVPIVIAPLLEIW